MKKSLYYFPFTLLMLLGCGENYLNLQPEVKQSTEIFYKTKAQFIQAINGAYAPLQAMYTGNFWALAEMRSDNTSYQYNLIDRSGFPFEEIDEFREISSNRNTTNFFNNSYSGISRANVILDRIGASAVEAASKDQIIGEASFLRAFNYFNLVRIFGNIPLISKEVKSMDEAFSAASKKSAAEVYVQILEDAKTAVQKLPESYAAAADKGRATKGTARTLLAEIYMTQENFAAAATELRSIVQSNKYSLLDNYADNFSITMKNGLESVFEIQYMEGPNGESSDFIYSFAPYNSGSLVTYNAIGSGASGGWNIPTQDLLDTYENGDIRKEASIGFNFTDPISKKVLPYIKKYQSAHSVRYQTANNFPVYRYSDVLLMLAECLNEAGFTADGEAFSLLNQIRKRAKLADKTSSHVDPSLKISSQEEFRNAIAKERQVELAFENHRWFDLLRTNKVKDIMTPHATHEKAAKSHVISASYQDLKTLYQYPQREDMLLPK